MTLSRYTNFRFRASLLVPATLLLLTACAITPTPVEVHKSESDDRHYRYLELDNGMKVLLVQEPESDTAAVSLAVDVGSFHNPEAFPGLAHYLEHMLFLGTENYPEPNALQKFLENNAGQANAYTASDHTNYFFQVPLEQLDPALDRYSDYFKAPLFDREYSDKERTAVHNEWSMGKSQDRRILYQLRGLTANPDHPAARLSVGNRETLPGGDDSGLYQAMLDFYERYYSANRMSLVMVSRDQLDVQQTLVEKHLAEVPNRDAEPAEAEVPGLPPVHQGKHIHYVPQKDLKEIVIEYPLTDNSGEWRRKANHYVSQILSSEEPGTLGHYLREQNLANTMTVNIESGFYGKDGFLRVNIDATSQGMKQRDQVIAATLAYIDRVREEGVTEAYYEEYRKLAERQFANQSAPAPLQQAVHLSVNLHELPPAFVNSAWAHFDEFDPEAIQSVLDQLDAESMRIWQIGLEEPVDTAIPHYDGHYSVRDITEQEITRWQTLADELSFELPPANEFAIEVEGEKISHDVTEWTRLVNEPGVEAWFRHAEYHQEGKAFAHWVLNTDLGTAGTRQFVLGVLVNNLLQELNTSLIDRAARAGVNIRFGRAAGNMQNLTISGPVGNHPQLADSLFESLSTLDFSDRDFEQAVEKFQEWISGERKDAPMKQLNRMMRRETRPFEWDTEEILAVSETVTPEQLRQYHRELKETSYLRLYAYGHYSEQQVQTLARYANNALGPVRRPGPIRVEPVVVPEAGEQWQAQREINHSDVGWMKVYVGEESSLDTLAELLILNGLVHNPFYTQLRTEEQWGYAVGANATRLGDYPAFYFLVQSSERTLSDIEQRVARFQREYAEGLNEITEEEVEGLRSSILAQITQKPNDFYAEANLYLQDFYRNNTGFDTREQLREAVEAVTRDDVVRVYRDLIGRGRAGTLTLEVRGDEFSVIGPKEQK